MEIPVQTKLVRGHDYFCVTLTVSEKFISPPLDGLNSASSFLLLITIKLLTGASIVRW